MRRTKIVCTLGPTSSTEKIIRAMVKAGMNVARLNFSHGTQDEHLAKIKIVRRISREEGKPIAILMDLQGPRVRVGKFAGGKASLRKGREFVLTSKKVEGSSEIVSVTYSHLHKDVKVGDPIYLNDGLIRLVVKRVKSQDIFTEIIEGGPISDHKGINLPATTLSAPSITKKDFNDLSFGLEAGVDYVGLSFVRSPHDLRLIKKAIRKAGHNTPVIAKIEKFEALSCLDEIIAEADGVMVARGDLGVEIPLEEVPAYQKKIIATCAQKMKPVITATQMLESMVEHPRPTRAEVSDVANAILDGTDAVMLSAETSAGQFPVIAVKTMARIAERTDLMRGECGVEPKNSEAASMSESVAHSACFLADRLQAKAIIAFTESGFTARLISKFHPARLVVAVTPHEKIYRRMALYRGVMPILGRRVTAIDDMIAHTVERVKKMGLVKKGDRTVITAGMPLAVTGATNLIKVHTI